jgi:hypothetical protein
MVSNYITCAYTALSKEKRHQYTYMDGKRFDEGIPGYGIESRLG